MDINGKLNIGYNEALNTKLQNIKKSYETSSSSVFALPKDDDKPLTKETIENRKKLREVSKDFESLMINMMLKEMRKTVNKSGLTDAGMAEEIFEDMLYDEYSKEFAKNGSIGIADMIYNQMEKYV